MGGIGGGDAGGALGGFGNYAGSNVGNFGGGGAAMGPGYTTIAAPPVSALIGGNIGQTPMSAAEEQALNEALAQQSLMSEAEAQQMAVDSMLGTNQGQSMSFGYGNSLPFPEAGLPQGGRGGFLTNYLLPALNMMTSSLIPMSAPVKGLAGGFYSGLQAALRGYDFPTIAGEFAKGAVSGAIPFAGQILGQLPDQGTGNVASVGQGIPGETGGYTDVGQPSAAAGPPAVAGPSPVAQAVAPPPMLSPQPFGWYSQGMKRVNMPWVSQPGSQQLRGNPSGNYGGMRRV